MLKKISLPALLLLLLVACRQPPYRTKDLGPAAPPPQLPDIQCQGQLPEALKEKTENYRLAQEADFVPSIREYDEQTERNFTCSIFTADFNNDGAKEYALLLVDPKTSNFRFELLVNRGTGKFGTAVVKTFQPATKLEEGVVYTSMNFKPAGESGPAQRDYFPLKAGTPERKSFEAQPAIELWRALDPTENGLPKNLEVSTLAYCSDIFYFVNGKLERTSVCD